MLLVVSFAMGLGVVAVFGVVVQVAVMRHMLDRLHAVEHHLNTQHEARAQAIGDEAEAWLRSQP